MTASADPLSRRATALAPAVFTLTIFSSAALLFFVQPLFTRIVLPQIGGAPAVWTTAMLFFQSVLLAGYLYAHLLVRLPSVAAQAGIHLALWAAALLFLPLGIPEGWRYDATGSTVAQTLALYALGVGLPFAVLSANAPLLQAWYRRSGGASAEDPYFLYGASNLGSLLALLAFPLAAEPLFGMRQIGAGWAAGFVALGGLLAACAVIAAPRRARAAGPEAPAAAPVPVRAGRIAQWLVLAFVPSSLLLGVTAKISTDLGSFPLVWVVPLALYLLTFVLAFTNRPPYGDRALRLGFCLGLAALVTIASRLGAPTLSWTSCAILLVAFFVVALAGHRALYALRPGPGQLTLFYVVMSVGGALGGVFNSILAPVVFDDFHELRITVALAALLLVPAGVRIAPRDIALGIALAALAPAFLTLGALIEPAVPFGLTVVAAGAALAAGLWALRARGLAAAVGAVGFLGIAAHFERNDAILRDRSFFGAHSVIERDGLRYYMNGTTVHGAQRLADLAGGTPRPLPQPLLYYHPDGPLGEVLASPRGRAARAVGVVGLGVGALACYRRPGQDWHFYEIDAKVDAIARDPALFTFVPTCAPDAPTHLGDARIVLDRQDGPRFDVLVIDAFSSDSIPVHLTTTEAMELYLRRLAPGGLLVYHASNRYFDVPRPIARSAALLGLEARVRAHGLNGEALADGDRPTLAIVLSADPAALAPFSPAAGWHGLESDGRRPWTDDYANVLEILKR